jgi:hypothetical protein
MNEELCDLYNHRCCVEFVQEHLEPLMGKRTKDGKALTVKVAGGSFIVKAGEEDVIADGHFFCLENRPRLDGVAVCSCGFRKIGRYRFGDIVMSPDDMVRRIKGTLE